MQRCVRLCRTVRPAQTLAPSARRWATTTSPSDTPQQVSQSQPKDKPSKMTDPYPLPLQHPLSSSDDALASQPHPTELSSSSPEHFANESVDRIRARLVYQTRKRGTLETGLLLSSWATSDRLSKMSREELMQLDRLLTIPEWTLYYWAIDKKQPPEDSEWHNSSLLAELREHSKNKEKEPRVMPELPHD